VGKAVLIVVVGPLVEITPPGDVGTAGPGVEKNTVGANETTVSTVGALVAKVGVSGVPICILDRVGAMVTGTARTDGLIVTCGMTVGEGDGGVRDTVGEAVGN
jgi:hypothetical protein